MHGRTGDSAADALLADLRAALGESGVLAGGDRSAWDHDWSGRYRGRSLAVVRPVSTAQVAAVVRCCAAHGASLVPQGGNTGMVGGGVPDDSGRQVVLSLRGLNRIRAIDPDNLTMVAEAGCVLQTVQEAAAARGLLFPLSLAAEGSCTIGGNLATNAGGTQVVRYGNARALCLGLEAVTADGRIWDGLTGLRKDNAGYDLRDLLIGSEGTLGVITAATLALQPAPTAGLTAWACVDDVAQAIALLGLARRMLAGELTSFELISAEALALVAEHHPPGESLPPAGRWSVLLEASSSALGDDALFGRVTAAFESAAEQGLITDAVVATSERQSRQLWQVREAIPLAQAAAGPALRHDIALPISAIPRFLDETGRALAERFAASRVVAFGHLGDGNLHYNLMAPIDDDAAVRLGQWQDAVHDTVWSQVVRHGGSIAAEHGIGQKMAAALPRYKSPVAVAMMAAVKTALDPSGLFNPGRVLAAPVPGDTSR